MENAIHRPWWLKLGPMLGKSGGINCPILSELVVAGLFGLSGPLTVSCGWCPPTWESWLRRDWWMSNFRARFVVEIRGLCKASSTSRVIFLGGIFAASQPRSLVHAFSPLDNLAPTLELCDALSSRWDPSQWSDLLCASLRKATAARRMVQPSRRSASGWGRPWLSPGFRSIALSPAESGDSEPFRTSSGPTSTSASRQLREFHRLVPTPEKKPWTIVRLTCWMSEMDEKVTVFMYFTLFHSFPGSFDPFNELFASESVAMYSGGLMI